MTSIYHPETDDPHEESQLHRTLNIYIEVEEQQEAADHPPTIESTLDEQEPVAPTTDEANTPLTIKQYPPSRYRTEEHITTRQQRPHPAILLLLIVPLLGLLAGIAYTLLLPLWTPSASVTIVTASQQLTTTSTIELVTNGPTDPT